MVDLECDVEAEPLSACAPLPADLFGYEVLEQLGIGAGSTVYAVCQRGSGQVFALKIVTRRNPKDERFIEQLTNEYAVARNFRHPRLRRCTLLRHKRDWSFKVCEAALMMELIDGQSLTEIPRLSIGRAMDCLTQTAEALMVLHGMGYIHCDLKPGNLMLTASGEVRLIDYGQACRIGTIKERIQGTPGFISLEQIRCQPVTPRTDVFSFGATMYWVLTGQNIPTDSAMNGDEPTILVKQLYPSPHELRPEVPPRLSDLIMRCVRFQPADRPSDMGLILCELKRLATRQERVAA